VVLDAPSADYFLVSARHSGPADAAQGVAVFLLARQSAGISLFEYPTQSGGRAADLRLDDVVVDDAALIGRGRGWLGTRRTRVDKGIAALVRRVGRHHDGTQRGDAELSQDP